MAHVVLPKEVQRQRVHQLITSSLLDSIIRGNYRPGDYLPTEIEVGERFGASRTAVREALKILQAKGIVSIEHGRGTRVNLPQNWNIFDPEVIEALQRQGLVFELLYDLLEFRRIVEVEAARLAAVRATEQDLARLRATLEVMQGALRSAEEYFRLDVEFHGLLFHASKNEILRRALEPIKELLRVLRWHVIQGGTREAMLISLSGHTEILAAVERRDAVAAAESMRQHLDIGEREFYQTHPPEQAAAKRMFGAPADVNVEPNGAATLRGSR